MDVQVLNQAEVDRQKERTREAKELESITKRAEGTSDDPVRMYLKEMGSVPLLTREEEVEISKRIEKAQMQIERIIMRFRYSSREAISIAQHLLNSRERFDKVVAEKEVADKNAFLNLLPKLCDRLREEDDVLNDLLMKLRDKPADWYDEKQWQDISKAALVTLVLSIPGMALLFFVSTPLGMFWFTPYIFLALFLFSGSTLYFSLNIGNRP